MSCSATPSRGPRRSRVHCPQSMAIEEIYHRLNGFSKKMMLVERRRGACLLCQETELPAIVLRLGAVLVGAQQPVHHLQRRLMACG